MKRKIRHAVGALSLETLWQILSQARSHCWLHLITKMSARCNIGLFLKFYYPEGPN
jgi:hypothetical protein